MAPGWDELLGVVLAAECSLLTPLAPSAVFVLSFCPGIRDRTWRRLEIGLQDTVSHRSHTTLSDFVLHLQPSLLFWSHSVDLACPSFFSFVRAYRACIPGGWVRGIDSRAWACLCTYYKPLFPPFLGGLRSARVDNENNKQQTLSANREIIACWQVRVVAEIPVN